MEAKAVELKSNIPRSNRVKRERIKWMPYLFLLNQTFKFRAFFRTAAIIPWAISGVIFAPSVLLIASFLFYPMFNVFYYSLQNYNASKPYY
ncbi:hypothetical protein GC093_08535 [Paenibacillus sp. LMG 31456]|uniref:Sugar ABC transporter permease n=1 Tax=Paenibacillus foliorum TaxID=2654974 RepID=A0A972K0V5_9BACL|nr:sugar ABC transporter permease [Paenibacillus foliorum]NOU93263.1 hypothetical protein [Paenibacillus foliorum]